MSRRLLGRVAPVVGVTTAVLLSMAACGSEKATAREEEQTVSYEKLCSHCHGGDRTGTATAPGLQGLDELWTRDELVRYLSDPRAVTRETPRLQYVSERFRIDMPSFGHLPPEKLEALVDDLLAG